MEKYYTYNRNFVVKLMTYDEIDAYLNNATTEEEYEKRIEDMEQQFDMHADLDGDRLRSIAKRILAGDDIKTISENELYEDCEVASN